MDPPGGGSLNTTGGAGRGDRPHFSIKNETKVGEHGDAEANDARVDRALVPSYCPAQAFERYTALHRKIVNGEAPPRCSNGALITHAHNAPLLLQNKIDPIYKIVLVITLFCLCSSKKALLLLCRQSKVTQVGQVKKNRRDLYDWRSPIFLLGRGGFGFSTFNRPHSSQHNVLLVVTIFIPSPIFIYVWSHI